MYHISNSKFKKSLINQIYIYVDKIGEEGVKKEMLEKGISEEALVKVQPLFHFEGSIQDKITQLEGLLASSEEGKKGITELK